MSALITMVGASAPSHIYPGLPVMRELVRRGHRVRYAVGERLVPLVAPTGVEPVGHPTLLPGAGGPQEEWPEDVMAAMTIFLDEGIAVLPRLLDAHRDAAPDLVLYDIGGLAGPVAAARWGVPAVQLSPAHVAWEGYEDDNADMVATIWSLPGADDYGRRYTEWLRANGVDRPFRDVMGRPERCVALIPRAMQPHADRVRADIPFVGPCLDTDGRDDSTWEAPGDDRPLLYVAFGTAYTDQPAVYRACIDAFAGTGWRVVMAVGERFDPDVLGTLPEGFQVRRRVPQPAVLEYARAFITHAGMGSCAESLWFGVPTVAIPQAVDQFANAERLVELGVGRRLPGDEVTPARLRDAVNAVVDDPAVTARVAALRAEVRSAGGADRAADAVEAHLAG